MSPHSSFKCRDSRTSSLALTPMTLAIIWWLLVTSGAVLEPAHPLSLSGFVYFNLCCSYSLCFILHFHSLTSQGQHGLPACPTQCGSEASSIAWAFLWVLPSTHSDWKYFSPGNPVLTTKESSGTEAMGSSIYPQKASYAKDEMGLDELKREENSLGDNRKFWWMRCSSQAQGDHSRGVGSCPTGLPVFGLCLNLDWAPEPHRVPAFMCSEQRQVLCASLLLSLGLSLDVPGMFLPWKPGLFLPLELSISFLEMQASLWGKKKRETTYSFQKCQ